MVLASASRFIGRAIGKRLRRTYEERSIPALDARSEPARREWEQSRREQVAIVERHPDLRGCLRDQVVFLAGGTRAVPLADIPMPITLAQADALVGRLRAP
jgi:nucleoside-diphosphate-sugar epimerase